ncbi:MAG: fatty acid desaturase [Planctomycetes bacterium]|nr:fatty acid desaturase [Planctomycetota bacterium]
MTARTRGFGPLRARADLRALGFILALAALFSLQWSGAVRSLALLAATYLLAFVACIVKHNHIHIETFGGDRWNRGFSLLLSLLTGTPTTGIITAHNERHHGRNNTEQDFVRCSIACFRWNWLNLLAFPFLSVRAMSREKPSDLRRWRRSRPALFRQALIERGATYAAAALLLALDWRATLIYLIAPWLVAQWALLAINLLQHQGCDPESSHDHSRNITGRFVNWLLLNNGYHTAHHLRPELHWSLLPAFHRAHVEPRIRAELNARSLAVATCRQFFRRCG